MSHRVRIVALILALILPSYAAFAAEPKLARYYDSQGSVEIRSSDGKSIRFSIESVSNMGDVCSIENAKATKIKSGPYRFDDEDDCRLDLVFSGDNRLEIRRNESGCQSYCGVSAGFGDAYRIRPDSCGPASLERTRRSFQKLYDAKKYGEAFPLFEKALKECVDFLNPADGGNMRSDLALVAFKMGQKDKCLSQIKQARAEDPNLEPDAFENLPESAHYARIRTLSKQISFNEAKCAGK